MPRPLHRRHPPFSTGDAPPGEALLLLHRRRPPSLPPLGGSGCRVGGAVTPRHHANVGLPAGPDPVQIQGPQPRRPRICPPSTRELPAQAVRRAEESKDEREVSAQGRVPEHEAGTLSVEYQDIRPFDPQAHRGRDALLQVRLLQPVVRGRLRREQREPGEGFRREARQDLVERTAGNAVLSAQIRPEERREGIFEEVSYRDLQGAEHFPSDGEGSNEPYEKVFSQNASGRSLSRIRPGFLEWNKLERGLFSPQATDSLSKTDETSKFDESLPSPRIPRTPRCRPPASGRSAL